MHMSEPNGTDIWVDVRVDVAKPDCSVPKELVRIEHEKHREYGLRASNPSTLFDGVVPVIFEQPGCPGPCAITFLHHILRRRVHKLEQGSHLTHGVACVIAPQELFAPISCILLVTRYQMFQECFPIMKILDNPRELDAKGTPQDPSSSHRCSQGEPWPDAALAQPRLSAEHPKGGNLFLNRKSMRPWG